EPARISAGMLRRWRQQVAPKPPRSSSETTARDGETNLRSFNRPGRFRSMAGKVKVGIIGSRFEADIHAAAFQIMPDEAEVVAVTSPTPGNPEALAQKYGIPRVFHDYRAMLKGARHRDGHDRRAQRPACADDHRRRPCWQARCLRKAAVHDPGGGRRDDRRLPPPGGTSRLMRSCY